MEELEWIRRFEEEMKGEEIPEEYEAYGWESFSKPDLKAKIQELKRRVKNGERAFSAANCLGDLYYEGCKKHDIPVNYQKAIFWFRQAARLSNAGRGCVLYKLAYCYKYGRGKNGDTAKAFETFKALAEMDARNFRVYALLDHEELVRAANFKLADCYYRGIGTEKNVEKAISLWKENAEQSDEAACCNLGYEYLTGKYLKKDYEKGFYWTQKAAELGNVPAINNLGECYEKGNGVEKNLEKAVEYYKEAANRGSRCAKNNLKRLKKKGIITEDENG